MTASLPLLPRGDQQYLQSKGLVFEATREGAEIHLTLRGFVLPPSYRPDTVDLRIVLPPGYSNSNPDMFWTSPTVYLGNGNLPLRADHFQQFSDGKWQRWSRHFGDLWRPGTDGIRNYIAAVRRELARGL